MSCGISNYYKTLDRRHHTAAYSSEAVERVGQVDCFPRLGLLLEQFTHLSRVLLDGGFEFLDVCRREIASYRFPSHVVEIVRLSAECVLPVSKDVMVGSYIHLPHPPCQVSATDTEGSI